MEKVKTNIESVNGVMNAGGQQRMTSLEIAEVTGKAHKNVMQAIRKMEPAWQRVCGLKFQLTSRAVVQPNGGTRDVPCYDLTKTECLYIATKFNDEARARLVLRWQELEVAERAGERALMAAAGPLVDLSGSRGSQASVVVIMGTDGTALQLTPETVARVLTLGAGQGQVTRGWQGTRLLTAGLQGLLTGLQGLLPQLTALTAMPAEWRPYHGPVRTLVARTAHGIVREGVDDFTLYIRIPSKAYLEALGVSKETFFDAEFQKLMVQCAMNDE